jgi:hypothetical protein
MKTMESSKEVYNYVLALIVSYLKPTQQAKAHSGLMNTRCGHVEARCHPLTHVPNERSHSKCNSGMVNGNV